MSHEHVADGADGVLEECGPPVEVSFGAECIGEGIEPDRGLISVLSELFARNSRIFDGISKKG